MILLKRLHLNNFRSFDEATIEFSDFNVLVGANASGKSNVLQAIQFLKDIRKHGLDNAISLQGGMQYLSNMQFDVEKPTFIEAMFLLRSNYKDNLLGFGLQAINYRLKLERTNERDVFYGDSVKRIDQIWIY